MKLRQVTILIILTILLMVTVYLLLAAWEEHAGSGPLTVLFILGLSLVFLIATLFFRYIRQPKGDQYEV